VEDTYKWLHNVHHYILYITLNFDFFYLESNMNIVKTLLVIALFGGGIGYLLLRNKATMEAKAEQPLSLAISVTVKPVEEETLSESIDINGTLQANNEVPVIAETQGRVIKVYASLGEGIRAGSALVRVDTVLKYSAFLLATSNFDKAKKDLGRSEALRKENNASESEVETAQLVYQNAKAQYIAAERQFSDAVIKSPISGTIVERPVNVGSMVMPGTPVATVVDISTLKLRANLPEQDVLKLHVGDDVSVVADIYPTVKFHGKVAFVSVRGNEAHSYPLEVVLSNSVEHPLKSGMSAHIQREIRSFRKALMIPRLAVLGSTKEPSVYVIDQANGKTLSKLRKVRLGNERGTKIEVISGLQLGERVIVAGQNNTHDSTEVIVK
jgi:RND family efflux transporter MFP subunit